MISGWTPINQQGSSTIGINDHLLFEPSENSSDKRQICKESTDDDQQNNLGSYRKRSAQRLPHQGSGPERSKPSGQRKNLNLASHTATSAGKRKAHKSIDTTQDLPRTKPKRRANSKNYLPICPKHSICGATQTLPVDDLNIDAKNQAVSPDKQIRLAVAPAASDVDRRYGSMADANQTESPARKENYEPPQPARQSLYPENDLVNEALNGSVVQDFIQTPTEYVDPRLSEGLPTASHSDQVSQATEQAMQLLAEQAVFGDYDDDLGNHELSDELFNNADMEDELPEWLEPPRTTAMGNCLLENDIIVQNHQKCTKAPSTLFSQPCAPLKGISPNVRSIQPNRATKLDDSENEYFDADLDNSLIDLTASDKHVLRTPETSPFDPTNPNPQWLAPKSVSSNGSGESPTTLDVPHKIQFNSKGEPIPFIRSCFPALARDRSPIHGLSNRTALRTCIRIGEALKAACQAPRTNIDAVIELYARVIDSLREGHKQLFTFADLFTDKPPYLTGAYGVWKGVGLWDQDSAAFLGEEGKGKMCRVLGRIKREKGRRYEMTILSVWECGWEEVGIAKGVAIS